MNKHLATLLCILAATTVLADQITRSAAKRLAPAAKTHAALHPSIHGSQCFDSEWVAARSAVVEDTRFLEVCTE